MTDQQQTESGPKSLYQITGDIADINTILVNRGEFHRLQVDLERERQRSRALNGAYDAARRKYKRQQKAAQKSAMLTTMISFYLDCKEANQL